jgi:hypothetical protein
VPRVRWSRTELFALSPQATRDAWQQALTILDDLDHPDADTVRAKLHQLDQTPARIEEDRRA